MFEKREVSYYHFGEVKGKSISDISTFFEDLSFLVELKEVNDSVIIDEKIPFVFKNDERY